MDFNKSFKQNVSDIVIKFSSILVFLDYLPDQRNRILQKFLQARFILKEKYYQQYWRQYLWQFLLDLNNY